MHSKYVNNVPTDSSVIYYENGNVETIIKYISPTMERRIYFDRNIMIKRIDNIEIIPTNKVTFKSGSKHTNTYQSIKTEYFKP